MAKEKMVQVFGVVLFIGTVVVTVASFLNLASH